MTRSSTAVSRSTRWLAEPFGRRQQRNRELQNRSAARALRFELLEHRLLLATVTLTPIKDNTLIEFPVGNSAGAHELYAGRVGSSGNNSLRRAALAFDLTRIPAGSAVSAASLDLFASRVAGSGNQDMSLHKLAADWGDGTSFTTGCRVNDCGGRGGLASNNEVTWLHRHSPGTAWTNPGGDFVSATSATTSVGGAEATYT